MIHLGFADSALEVGPGVDSRRSVTLVEDLVPAALAVLTSKEVVEPDFVQRGGRRVRRKVTADPGEL